MDFIKAILASVVSVYYLVFSPFLGASQPQPNTPSPTPTETIKMLHASGTYSNSGVSVGVSLKFPENGGQVSGKFSGVCEGSFSGTYDQDIIEGNGSGVCKILILTLDATIEAKGKVDKENKRIDMNFNGKASEYTHSGTIHLIIN